MLKGKISDVPLNTDGNADSAVRTKIMIQIPSLRIIWHALFVGIIVSKKKSWGQDKLFPDDPFNHVPEPR